MPEIKLKTPRELDRSLMQIYQNENAGLSEFNQRYGLPTVNKESRAADIKQMTSNVERMKEIRKRNIGGHHSANDGSFLASRAAKFGCMGKCGKKK